MKTPKRYQNKPIPTMPEDSEPDWYVLNEWCQRAKRKNLKAQLKRTIARLTEEKEAAQQKAENISYSTRELIAAIARQMRPMHITGTLAPHYFCLTENTATRNSTTANTY